MLNNKNEVVSVLPIKNINVGYVHVIWDVQNSSTYRVRFGATQTASPATSSDKDICGTDRGNIT